MSSLSKLPIFKLIENCKKIFLVERLGKDFFYLEKIFSHKQAVGATESELCEKKTHNQSLFSCPSIFP